MGVNMDKPNTDIIPLDEAKKLADILLKTIGNFKSDLQFRTKFKDIEQIAGEAGGCSTDCLDKTQGEWQNSLIEYLNSPEYRKIIKTLEANKKDHESSTRLVNLCNESLYIVEYKRSL